MLQRNGGWRGRKADGWATLGALGAGLTASAALAQQSADPFDLKRSDENKVAVSEYLTVDLHVQDEELANVLQMLSLQSQRNIVVSKDVSASITADLYGVTFYEALDAILHVNGYGYVEQGNFIFVYTLEEIAQIQAAQRKQVTKVIRLNYLNATDAAGFVQPMLSESGQIKTNGDVGKFSIPDDTPVGAESFALAATMVVTDYPEHVDAIVQLVAELDTKPSQVLVEATILQTSLSEANAFGVDFSIIGDVDFFDFLDVGGPLGAANAIQAGGDGSDSGFSPADNQALAITSSPGNTGGPATFKLGIVDDDFAVFMRLLDEVSDFTVLSNPKVLALNRQPARVLVGRRIGYLNTTSTETSTTQTVEFLDTGTQLRFRPFISNDGLIRMELNPSVSEGFIREALDETGASVSIPDEVTQELTTNVIVRDGSTIVLGGLFKETTTLRRRQVPFLGDIPLLGAAFSGHEDDIQRSEIIFMITPTVMADTVLADQGDRAQQFVENVRTGSRQGLLPWSRERMTAMLNVEAEKLAAEGQTDKALYKIRRSLELNSVQPEVIRLREKLLNERDLWPSRSILDEIVGDPRANNLRSQASRAKILGEADEHADADDRLGRIPAEPQPVGGSTDMAQWPAEELEQVVDDRRSQFQPPTSPDRSVASEDADKAFERGFGAGEPAPASEPRKKSGFDAPPDEPGDDFNSIFDTGPATEEPTPDGAPDPQSPQASAWSRQAERTPGSLGGVRRTQPSAKFSSPGLSEGGQQSGAQPRPGASFDAFSDPITTTAFGPVFMSFGQMWSPFAGFGDATLEAAAMNAADPVVVDAQVTQPVFIASPDDDPTYQNLVNLLNGMFEEPTDESEVAEVDSESPKNR